MSLTFRMGIGVVTLCLMVTAAGSADAQDQGVLSTRDKTAQCNAIHEWVGITRELGGPKVMTGNMVMTVERRAMAPAFADDIFPRYFGKPYFSLSGGDKRTIDKILKRCSQNGTRYWYGTSGLSEAFQTRADRYNIAAWHEEIRKHKQGSSILARKQTDNVIEAERQQQKQIVRTTNKVWTVNRAGDLLQDRPDYSIHAFKSDSHDFRKPCKPTTRSFNASILVKDQTARLHRAYVESVIKNGLMPLVRSICPEATDNVTAQFFFKDVQLDNSARRFTTSTVSTQFDFFEMPFLRATSGLDATGGLRAVDLHWFKNHRPGKKLQPYYETLAGLTHIGRQKFLSDDAWAARQQARADRAARLARARIDAVALAGFRLEGKGGVGLITGVEPDTYFQTHRRDLVAAIVAYSVAISDLCRSRDVPGGLTIVSYTNQPQIRNARTGEVRNNGQPTKMSFFWPRDFFDVAERAVNRGAGLSRWLKRADRSPYYRDVQTLVAKKGCASPGLVAYHESLRDVAYRVGGDWHDFTAIFELLSDIYREER